MAKDYNQMELDVTLSHERKLKDNVITMVEFVYKQNVANGVETIKNKHEAYGVAAENHALLAGNVKSINADMGTMLKLLPGVESDFISATTSLYNSAVETAMTAIKQAAEAKRIIDDLYYAVDEATPIEEYIEEVNNNFEEAEEA